MDKCNTNTSACNQCNNQIIVKPSCCNNDITWNNIKDKPFQDVDKNFFDIDSNGNVTLSNQLNSNLYQLNVTVNEITTTNNQLVNRLESVEKSIEFKDF